MPLAPGLRLAALPPDGARLCLVRAIPALEMLPEQVARVLELSRRGSLLYARKTMLVEMCLPTSDSQREGGTDSESG